MSAMIDAASMIQPNALHGWGMRDARCAAHQQDAAAGFGQSM
jgi:hypothetical protein